MYIIDIYNKFGHNKDVVQIDKINGLELCIREIKNLEWGQPVFPDKNVEEDFTFYHIYENLEDAREYIHQLRYYTGIKL